MGFARTRVAFVPATHAIRWMAGQGWTRSTIRKVLDHLGASSIKANTINCQITAAKRLGVPSLRTSSIGILNKAKDAVLNEAPPPKPKPQQDNDMATKTKDGIVAKFSHSCKICGEAVEAGDKVIKRPLPGASYEVWAHPNCQPTNDKVVLTNDEKRVDEALALLLGNRVNELEQQVAKQAKQIELLRKEQPPREIVLVKPDKKKVQLKEHVHPIFEQVMFHIQAGDNVQLVGPRGCGKTTLAEQVAKALERPYGMLSLSGGVTEGKLFGRVTPDINTGKNVYHRALFTELFEEGGVFLLDEVDAADPNVLLSVNSGLANGQLALDRPKNPMAQRHADFVCLAAANTWGNGADRQYVGRNQQDTAFTERFVQLSMDYDKELERALCPGADELLERLWKYRTNIGQNKLERTVSTRFICRAYNWTKWKKDLDYIDQMVFAGWRTDEIKKAKE